MLLWKQRVQHESLLWLLRELMGHGGLLCFPSWAGATVTEALSAARITTMGALLEVTGPDLEIEEECGAPAEPPENLPDGKRMATVEKTQRRTDFSLSRFLFPSLIIAPGPDQQHEVALEKRRAKLSLD